MEKNPQQLKKDLETELLIQEKEEKEDELARQDLQAYITSTFPAYIWSKWNRVLCRILSKVELGEIQFLLLMVSPRWGKTELVAKRFPGFVFGRSPQKKCLIASYSDLLAGESARHCLQYMKKESYTRLFSFQLGTKKEGGNWELAQGGGYYSAGLLGSLTGKGYDIGIIDDYVKNREEAESLTIRNKTYENYTSAFVTRDEKSLQKETAKIIFATRWNSDDLGGRILERFEENGDNIVELDMEKSEEELMKDVEKLSTTDKVVFKVPALNAAGESNYPERFSTEQLLEMKKEVSLNDWEALYMQDPIKGSGITFKRELFEYFSMSDMDEIRKEFTFAIHIDPAWSTKKDSDDISIELTARNKKTKEIFLVDILSKPLLPSDAYAYIVNLAERAKKMGYLEFISVEKVNLSKKQDSWIKNFELHLRQQGKFYNIIYYNPVGKGQKIERIKFYLEPMFNRRALHFRNDHDDTETWRQLEIQLIKFPASPKFDMIDCLAQGVDVWSTRGVTHGDGKGTLKAYMEKIKKKREMKNARRSGLRGRERLTPKRKIRKR